MSGNVERTGERGIAESVRSLRKRPRRAAELAGLAVTAALALAMLGFVACYWLRAYPVAGPLYEQYLIVGEWIDLYLGTNVFEHPLMWQQLSTGVLVGVVAPLVGTFLVHRQMALIGETLAHTAFAGVAIGFAAGSVTGWGGSQRGLALYAALVVGVLGALGVQWLSERTDAYGDVPIAIMLTGSFALGTIVVSYGPGQQGFTIDEYLFGNLSVVTPAGARLMAVLSVVVVAAVALAYKQLVFITFDEQAARVARLNVTGYNTLLVVLTAVVVVGSMQVLGVILVAGMLVIPVAAASQVARGFRETLYLSVLAGQAAIVGGFAAAIRWGLPSGGSIVLVAVALYLLAVAASNRSTTAISTH
ncbi:metal ABC transporter permease [Salinilacihabitans rarus]|uniref:metal ABC transporter permease n=1 Tax=Salinilacihabitans rarus TaxID=2961596 RepID=UPI0020C901EA|nr:metal ABC transporter permease [Salinilacihabitans rarus]